MSLRLVFLGSPPFASPVFRRLVESEHEVLALIAAGKATREIADALYVSPSTVRNHVHNILAKLGVHSRLEAVTTALRFGVL